MKLYEQKINEFIRIKIGKDKMESTLGAVLPGIIEKQGKHLGFKNPDNK